MISYSERYNSAQGIFGEKVNNPHQGRGLLKFSIRENTNIFIFILLEFQRTYEKMFLRLHDYLNRIYRNQKKKSDKLSVVVPIILRFSIHSVGILVLLKKNVFRLSDYLNRIHSSSPSSP